MKEHQVADLSGLPLHGLGTASLTWWGNLGYMLIEGSGFVLVIATYLYLESIAPSWPLGAPPPGLAPGTAMTVLLLASLWPNALLNRWSHQQDLHKSRLGLYLLIAFGVAALVVRVYEFRALHVSWDTNAYGSVVWLLLGLHTAHILTDVIESVVLVCLMHSRHGDNRRRYGDLQDNALYWNFVVAAWLPIYGCIYWLAR